MHELLRRALALPGRLVGLVHHTVVRDPQRRADREDRPRYPFEPRF